MKLIKGLMAMTLLVQFAQAKTIAVIDSGVDYKHTELASKMWINPLEIANNGRDEDNNGYQDDVYGWNFAEQTHEIIDYKYLGTFSEDPRKFFEIQGRMFTGTATEADLAWVKEKRGDPEFAKEMGKFGNFVHGTHVAGITVKGNSQSKLMGVKLIPTEVKPFLAGFLKNKSLKAGGRMKLVKGALTALAGVQMKMMEEIGVYINNHGVHVANGSFGTGFDQAKMITSLIFKGIFWRKPKQEELHEITMHFMSTLLIEGKKMMAAAPKTLFVFAAGNSAADNDALPTSPTNVRAENSMSVAATFRRGSLATFSNYGAELVDVAAPGVLIDSAIPGNERLRVSGTSQAAPYIAGVALMVQEANPALSPKEVKQIILGTVDLKEFLKDKVKTSGIVNKQRAVRAGTLSKSISVLEAIVSANLTISDVKDEETKSTHGGFGIVTPIQSMFKL